ncbi:MAG: LmeA family phospholipid-binding protein [Armatimonadetes bacterium]|nr:LmeA family phospholipid-binding protein [Armatimonadota bacterium]
MAQASQTAPSKKRSGLGKWLGIAAVVGLVLVFGGLFVLRGVATSKAEQALTREVGAAQSWKVKLGIDALPKALLGMGFGAQVSGREIQTKGKPQIKSLDIDATGLRVSVKQAKLLSAERIGVKASLGEQAVVQFVRQEAMSSRMFSDVTVQFGVGEVLLTGAVTSPVIQTLTGQSSIYATAKAKPAIKPPASVEMLVSGVTLRGAEGQINVPTSYVSGIIARDLNFDLRRLLPGLVLQNVNIVDGALAVDGTIDAAALLKGDGGGKQGTPALPDPSVGKSVTQ